LLACGARMSTTEDHTRTFRSCCDCSICGHQKEQREQQKTDKHQESTTGL
jgi:hypothetical protein